jgi:hypothetical protein
MILRTLSNWLLADLRLPKGVQGAAEPVHDWWRVMCLTGVDYFSTLGYQPGIAFLAAGILSPLATLVLVLVTLFAALPLYQRVAKASPNGQGSIAMLERLFPEWGGKVFVLVLLGFATTDFMITMTLSAAAYLVLNAVVTIRTITEVLRHPELVRNWESALLAQHPNWWATAGVCLLMFPRLALGLSGFETGVAVMPLIKGER